MITGGGTGGHVFPALAIAQELQSRGFSLRYVGTAHGMEAKLVPEKGIPFFTVRTGAVKNQGISKILKTLFQLVFAVLWSIRFLISEKPQAVVGVGGYVSVPICFAAFLLRIPLYLQEQNTSVGIANRFLGRLSGTIFLGFEQAKSYFNAQKCIVTGNPIRHEFSNPGVVPLNAHSNTLVVLGGSQGAKAINDAMIACLEKFQSRYPGLNVIHQTGQRDFESVKDQYQKHYRGNAEVAPFIRDMVATYGKAAMVISRSGALTVSELIAAGRPAVLVPYPRKGQNDQTTNARFLEANGVARVVEQGEKFVDRFWKTITDTLDPDTLKRMGEGYSRLRTQEAIVSIGDHIEKDLQTR